jgi:hypothetical protein
LDERAGGTQAELQVEAVVGAARQDTGARRYCGGLPRDSHPNAVGIGIQPNDTRTRADFRSSGRRLPRQPVIELAAIDDRRADLLALDKNRRALRRPKPSRTDDTPNRLTG